MIRVKWVHEKHLQDECDDPHDFTRCTRVIELVSLRDVVEGLKVLARCDISGPLVDEWGRDPKSAIMPFVQWLPQRLLAQLEVEK